jgi:hypothetical protein
MSLAVLPFAEGALVSGGADCLQSAQLFAIDTEAHSFTAGIAFGFNYPISRYLLAFRHQILEITAVTIALAKQICAPITKGAAHECCAAIVKVLLLHIVDTVPTSNRCHLD